MSLLFWILARGEIHLVELDGTFSCSIYGSIELNCHISDIDCFAAQTFDGLPELFAAFPQVAFLEVLNPFILSVFRDLLLDFLIQLGNSGVRGVGSPEIVFAASVSRLQWGSQGK